MTPYWCQKCKVGLIDLERHREWHQRRGDKGFESEQLELVSDAH